MKTSYILEHQNFVKHPVFRNRESSYFRNGFDKLNARGCVSSDCVKWRRSQNFKYLRFPSISKLRILKQSMVKYICTCKKIKTRYHSGRAVF